MKKKTGLLNFEQGIEGVMAPKESGFSSPQANLPPSDQHSHIALKAALAQPNGLDEILLREIKPSVQDKMTLAPMQYQALLAKAVVSMQQLGSETKNEALFQCATLVAEELKMLNLMSVKRASLSGM